MNTMPSLIYLILSFIQFIIMLRFLCQACSVNYYNPVTQSIVRISNFILKPFDIIGLHLNSYILFLLLYLFTFVKIYIPLIVNNQFYPTSDLSIVSLAYLIKDIINIYWYLVIISSC